MTIALFVDYEERIPLTTSTTFGYDNNGNLTSYTGGNTLTWNYKNQLTGSTIASSTATYAYDHTGQRVSQTKGGVTTVYPNNLYEKTGTSTLKNIYLGDQLVATVSGSGSTTATTTYIHADHLGSTRFVTDAYGNVIQSLDYAPFGAETTATGTPKTDRHYIGQVTDASSLSYLQNRYYSGQRGQFLSEDPVFWEVGQTEDGKAVMMNPQLQNSYRGIYYQPTFIVGKVNRSIYIVGDSEDKKKIIEMSNTSYSRKTLIKVIKDLKKLNLNIELDDFAQKLIN